MKGGNDIYCYIKSAAIWGIEPYIVDIEADITSGMPCFNMVGLLASEVREARERVRSAIKNSGETLPAGRITINLSPADRRKEGTGFDLPIAIALLCSMGRLKKEWFEDTVMIGELGLDGEVKPVRGILPIVYMADRLGIKRCVIPYGNRTEGYIFDNIEIIAVKSLKDIINIYTDEESSISNHIHCGSTDKPGMIQIHTDSEDYSDIYGQETAKRAIVIAVAGYHNLLMVGTPGVGKSMLASRIPTIMPELSMEERIEVSGIYSICGLLSGTGLVEKRPFSSPHHTITTAGLIGGGNNPRPGEITIAHKGVLFLDELPEFQPNVLDSLRQPLEEKMVKIHRNSGSYVFPADCLLVAAMNPCRCGYYPDRNRCKCSLHEVNKYMSRISGPLLDRMDMSIEVPRVGIDIDDLSECDNHMGDKREDVNSVEFESKLSNLRIGGSITSGACDMQGYKNTKNEKYVHRQLSSADMKKLVDAAIDMQLHRQQGVRNGSLTAKQIKEYCVLDREAAELLGQAYERFEMSMRGYTKVLKIARTIADIEQSEKISINHIAEALAYRVSVQNKQV